MELFQQAIDFVRHLDTQLPILANQLGPWTYVLLFVVVFCETGLVVTPMLPGDSLLFAIGVLAVDPGQSLVLWIVVLIAAAVSGDAVNYYIGYRLGPRVFKSERSRLLNKKHLLRAQRFYEKYGSKTIILARFIPIIRTFAPFVAGIGKMEYRRFFLYNVVGAVAWVLLFVLGGFVFGESELVKRNFEYVILAIIVISVLPAVIEFILARRRGAEAESPAVPVHESSPERVPALTAEK